MQGIRADFWIVAGEGAVLEDRIAEQVGGRHGDDESRVGECLAKLLFDGLRLGRCGVDGNQVVVMEIHSIRADLPEQVNEFGRCLLFAHRRTERISASRSNGPQTEGKFVFGFGGEV